MTYEDDLQWARARQAKEQANADAAQLLAEEQMARENEAQKAVAKTGCTAMMISVLQLVLTFVTLMILGG